MRRGCSSGYCRMMRSRSNLTVATKEDKAAAA
jgi:hypothetical protein